MGQANARDRTHRRIVSRAVVLGSLVAISLCAIAVYRHLIDPDRIRRLAIEQLERATGRNVEIQSATFSIRDGIQLREVIITNEPAVASNPEDSSASDDHLLTCHEISILQDSWALIRGQLEIESFEAIRPTLTLVHHAESGWSDVAALLRDLAPKRDGGNRVPAIELRHARVRLLHRSPRGEKEVEDFQLTVRGRRDSGNPDVFDIVWQDAGDPDANGHTQVDLASGRMRNVRGGLPGMSLRGILLAADAGYEGAEALTQTYGIRGRLRIRDFDVTPAAEDDAPRFATIELENAAISIPLSEEEIELPPEARHLRLHNISGTVTVNASGLTIDVNTQSHGSRITATASVTGLLRADTKLKDLQLEANVQARDVVLPDRDKDEAQRRFVEAWAPMDRFYDRFDPHGKIDANLRVEKKPGEPFQIRNALITAREGVASFHKFPYRVQNIHGSIAIKDPEGVEVRQLCGNHQETRVCLNGWMEAPRGHAQAQFTIAGTHVNIDDDLFAAMDPQLRQWVQSYQPAGTTDVHVTTERPRSAPHLPPAPWDTTIGLSLTGVAATVPQLPARITELTGRATVWSDRIELTEARGTVASGDLHIHGFGHVDAGGLKRLSLDIAIDDARLEPETVRYLPEQVHTQIDSLRATGCVSLNSELEFDALSGWDHQTEVQLRNLELEPEAFPLPIDRAFADLRITPGSLEIERARGVFESAELFAKGQYSLDEDGPASLTLEADHLFANERFRTALPASIRDVLADWRVDSPIQVNVRGDRIAREFSWSGQVRLNQATVTHRVLPQPLHQVDATVSFSKDDVRSSDIRANYGAAAVSGSFSYQVERESRSANVELRAEELPLDRSIRNLLPPEGQRTWDELQPAGTVRLILDSMRYQNEAGSSTPTWSMGGSLELLNVGLARDTVTSRGTTVFFDGWLLDRLGGLTLHGRLNGGRINVYGAPVQNPAATWYFARTGDGRGQAALRDFRGEVHSGTAAAQGQIQFDTESAQYRVASSLQDVDLAAWLASWRSHNSESHTPNGSRSEAISDVRGQMAVQLHMAGVVGNPESRTGGGRVEIRDGYIYKLPIFVAILKVLNISIPSQDVLTEASGQFYVMGNSVRIADIDVTGESLILIGDGTLSLSDQSVDLRLVNAGAGRLEGVPVLAELWKGASRQIVELRVTGPVSKPQVRAMPFGGVTEEIKKLFQKRQPRRNMQSSSP